jgi:hypothetical protein
VYTDVLHTDVSFQNLYGMPSQPRDFRCVCSVCTNMSSTLSKKRFHFFLAFIRQHGVRSKQIFTVSDTTFQHVHGGKVPLKEEWNGISELQWLCLATEPVNKASHASFHEALELCIHRNEFSWSQRDSLLIETLSRAAGDMVLFAYSVPNMITVWIKPPNSREYTLQLRTRLLEG